MGQSVRPSLRLPTDADQRPVSPIWLTNLFPPFLPFFLTFGQRPSKGRCPLEAYKIRLYFQIRSPISIKGTFWVMPSVSVEKNHTIAKYFIKVFSAYLNKKLSKSRNGVTHDQHTRYPALLSNLTGDFIHSRNNKKVGRADNLFHNIMISCPSNPGLVIY